MLKPDFDAGTIIVINIIGILFVAGLNIKIFIKLGISGLIGVIILVIIIPYILTPLFIIFKFLE